MLQCAEAWGIPPWEVEGGEASALWANRFIVYRSETRKIEDEANKRARMKSRG